jgi:hypothetical protein
VNRLTSKLLVSVKGFTRFDVGAALCLERGSDPRFPKCDSLAWPRFYVLRSFDLRAAGKVVNQMETSGWRTPIMPLVEATPSTTG